MKLNHRARTARRRGFTLVEILLVVVILAMLAAFVIPNVFSQQEQAQIDQTNTVVKSTGKLLSQYKLTAGKYPTTEQGLNALVEKPEGEDAPKKWIQVIEELPKDAWGNELRYAYPGEHNGEKKPDIWSTGPDGESGNDDDIGNWTTEEEEGSAPEEK